MPEADRVNKIAAKLIHSLEEILKYSQLNNTPELVKGNEFADDEEDDDVDNSYGEFSDDDNDGDEGSHDNAITSRNLLRNINAKRHELSSIDSIEQAQVVHKHSKNVVKSLQELLLITRKLKENWILEYNENESNVLSDEVLQKAKEDNDKKKEQLKSCIQDMLENI